MSNLPLTVWIVLASGVVLLGCSKAADPSASETAGSAGVSVGGNPNNASEAGCPLLADHSLELSLRGADFESTTTESGSAINWELSATPSAVLPAFAPGKTLAVTVRLEDGPVQVLREGRSFYVTIVASSGGSTRAQSQPKTVTAATGSMSPGPWQPALSLNASGKPIRFALGGIAINPNADDTLSCFSVRAEVPAQANSVEDSRLVDVLQSDPLPITEVRFSLSGDPPQEPFALKVGNP